MGKRRVYLGWLRTLRYQSARFLTILSRQTSSRLLIDLPHKPRWPSLALASQPPLTTIGMPSDSVLPQAVDLTHHLSTVARTRQPSPLKDVLAYMRIPGMVSLAGGLPHPSFFPFHSLSASVFPPSTVLDTENPKAPSESIDISVGRAASKNKLEISSGLQYSGGRGLIPLETFLRDLTAKLYPPSYGDWDLLLNSGATDAWNKILTLLVERGDHIITDSQVYPSAGAAFVPLGAKAVPIPVDGEGMRPDVLEDKLANWDESRGRRPRLAYLIPVGQNPLGCTMSLERRRAIYAIAVKYGESKCRYV